MAEDSGMGGCLIPFWMIVLVFGGLFSGLVFVRVSPEPMPPGPAMSEVIVVTAMAETPPEIVLTPTVAVGTQTP